MPDNLCRRRACLYQRQLTEARIFFEGLVKSADPRLEKAIQDPGLIASLEEILNIYVVYGVERDLTRLDPTKVLFLRDPSSRPALETVLPSDASKRVSYTADAASIDSAVTSATRYDRYFSWYIDPEDKPLSGVDPFYKRYPLLDDAVKTVTRNHKHNIELACERVARDWDTISAAFFGGNPMTKLIKIETTGNDFHKGGKQVLILTFQLTDPTYGRVVYKPSGVEIDCRLVGDSDIVNAPHVSPEGYHQDNSLAELINSFPRPEGPPRIPLPTYRILPYQRDSIADSYGYIEFLTHDPPVRPKSASADDIEKDVGTAVMSLKLSPAAVKQADWLITDPADAQVFYHQLGGLMAMATAVSLSDLHVQNAIAHARQPHLIDLEEALKRPMTKVVETYMDGWLDAFRDPEGDALNIENDHTSDLQARWGKQVGKPAPCALYLYRGTSTPAERVKLVGPAGSDGERNRRALVSGFVDVVEALAVQANNDAVKKWAEGLDRTIARYVTLSTATYAAACRRLYQEYCQNSSASLKQDDGSPNPAGYANFPSNDGKNKSFFAGAVAARREIWNSRMASVGALASWDWPPAPFFAVEHPAHAWRDYLNCDVPSFYHFLGSPDLLNTKGDPVDVAAAVKWQDTNMSSAAEALPKGWQPNAGGTYLPGPPIAMIKAQLDRLKTSCATVDGERAHLAAMLGAGPLAGDFTALSGRIVNANKQQVGAGKVGGSVQ